MFGVSFLSPVFLIGAVAAAVPILLHLFHRRTEVVIDFPSIRLLTRAPVQQHRRRRLRELVLLVLRVCALVLLAVSFARPYARGAAAPSSAPLTVVAADVSMSMSAPGQVARMREAVAEAIRTAPAGHAVSLVAFDDAAAVVVPPTTDRGIAQAGAATLEAGFGGTRFGALLSRAGELIGSREGRLVVVTDLQRSGWDASRTAGLPDGVGLEVVPVAPPRSNAAVVSASRQGPDVVATVLHHGVDPARLSLALWVEDRIVAQAAVDVAAQSSAEARFAAGDAQTGTARVVVEDAEGFQGDNTRFVVLDSPPAPSIGLIVADPAVATGGLYVERAVTVAGSGREFAVDAVDGRVASEWSAADTARHAALVVLGTRTLDRRGRERVRQYLRDGGQVLVSLGPDVDPATLADLVGEEVGVAAEVVAETATMVAADGRHPIFRPFLSPSGALADVQVERYRRLNDQEGRRVLARFSAGDPALTEQIVGAGRLLIFASDLDNEWSRFPLSPAFVPFVVETVRYLTADQRHRQAWTLPAVPSGVPPVPGVTTVDGDGAPYRVAVNVDARESSPAVLTPEEFSASITRTSRAAAADPEQDARALEGRQRWWQIGLLLMLAALAGEGLIGRRAA